MCRPQTSATIESSTCHGCGQRPPRGSARGGAPIDACCQARRCRPSRPACAVRRATIREKNIPVMIAYATVANTLVDPAVDQASSVESLVNDDLVSLEVGLNARAIHPRI